MLRLPLPLWIALGAVLTLGACGDDSGPASTAPVRPDAGGGERPIELDADVPLPRFDAAIARPDGAPPPELGGESCAVDTNKLFDLVMTAERPEIAPLAVDPIASRFGLAFVDASETCVDALYVAELQGGAAAGEPQVATALDECATIERTAMTYNGQTWLLAVVDNRAPPSDIWVQAFDVRGGGSTAFRASEAPARETALALASFDGDSALLAWTQRDLTTNENALKVRALSAEGQPLADAVTLEQGAEWVFTLPTLSRLGTLMALAYHRLDADGSSQAVLEMLDPATGERTREPWVLTQDAGPQPSIALGTDDEGGGVIYSSAAGGTGRQLWFRQLDENGDPAPVMSGSMVGGPSQPQRVVNAPYRAIDASIVKLYTGFAVAYRALPGGDVPDPRIKLHFLDRFGRVIGDSEVALTTEFGGRTSLAFSTDGRMVMGWSDSAEDGTTTIRMARMPCLGGG